METSTLPASAARIRARFYQPLGWLAVAGLILTEFLRRSQPQPPGLTPPQTLYWFADHVFFAGKLLVLGVMAWIPARAHLNPRFLLAGGAALLMLGSVLQLAHPLFLAALAVPFGVALKLAEPTEKLGIVLAMGGLGLGIPLNGFTGLLAAKANFHPGVSGQLFGSTAAVGALSIAAAYAGLYMLVRLLLMRRSA